MMIHIHCAYDTFCFVLQSSLLHNKPSQMFGTLNATFSFLATLWLSVIVEVIQFDIRL